MTEPRPSAKLCALYPGTEGLSGLEFIKIALDAENRADAKGPELWMSETGKEEEAEARLRRRARIGRYENELIAWEASLPGVEPLVSFAAVRRAKSIGGREADILHGLAKTRLDQVLAFVEAQKVERLGAGLGAKSGAGSAEVGPFAPLQMGLAPLRPPVAPETFDKVTDGCRKEWYFAPGSEIEPLVCNIYDGAYSAKRGWNRINPEIMNPAYVLSRELLEDRRDLSPAYAPLGETQRAPSGDIICRVHCDGKFSALTNNWPNLRSVPARWAAGIVGPGRMAWARFRGDMALAKLKTYDGGFDLREDERLGETIIGAVLEEGGKIDVPRLVEKGFDPAAAVSAMFALGPMIAKMERNPESRPTWTVGKRDVARLVNINLETPLGEKHADK